MKKYNRGKLVNLDKDFKIENDKNFELIKIIILMDINFRLKILIRLKKCENKDK